MLVLSTRVDTAAASKEGKGEKEESSREGKVDGEALTENDGDGGSGMQKSLTFRVEMDLGLDTR